MKKIAIFGSTGSIGTQTLDFIRKHEGIKADIIVANSNAELLIAMRQLTYALKAIATEWLFRR